jgi:hypothetical protein
MERIMRQRIISSVTNQHIEKFDAKKGIEGWDLSKGLKMKELQNDQFKKLTAKEIEAMGADFMVEYADLLTNSGMEGLKKGGAVSDRFYQVLDDKRKDQQKQNMKIRDKYRGIDPADVSNKDEREALERGNLMFRKIKPVRQEDGTFLIGEEKDEKGNIKLKMKNEKDILGSIHYDVYEEDGFINEANVTGNFVVGLAAQDRNKVAFSAKKREAFFDKVAPKAKEVKRKNAGIKHEDWSKEDKRIVDLYDTMKDPRTQRDFFGKGGDIESETLESSAPGSAQAIMDAQRAANKKKSN